MATINDLTAASSIADADKGITRKNGETVDKSFTWAIVKTWIKSWIVKDDVGLGNVNNTSDADKPVSDAQATINGTKITATQAAAGTDNDQTGTAYTLVLTDSDNKTVWMNNASANACTIPLNSAVAFPIGTKGITMMEGAGVTTINGSTGVTINGVLNGSVVINNQFQGATWSKRGTDSWIITGDIT